MIKDIQDSKTSKMKSTANKVTIIPSTEEPEPEHSHCCNDQHKHKRRLRRPHPRRNHPPPLPPAKTPQPTAPAATATPTATILFLFEEDTSIPGPSRPLRLINDNGLPIAPSFLQAKRSTIVDLWPELVCAVSRVFAKGPLASESKKWYVQY